MKKTIRDVDLAGKRVLVRVDYNVPQDKETGAIKDDTRIRASLPTLRYLLDNGASVIVMSHLGRPKDGPDPKYTLLPCAKRLEEVLWKTVKFQYSPAVVDDGVRAAAKALLPGEVMMLENVRFRPEETKNDAQFAKELAELGDLYVNDAFATAHRAHASTAGIADYIPAVSGFLMEKELQFLGDALERPVHPFCAIMGGAKVSDKIHVIENLLDKVDSLLIGGGMAFTFLKSMGYEVGTSLVEEDMVDYAHTLLAQAKLKNVKMLIPVDVVCADAFANDSPYDTYDASKMPNDRMGLDIGPKTAALFRDVILEANTVLWNGPMGVFEMPNFAVGTKDVAQAVADNNGLTIIGGGDSVSAINMLGLQNKITHISTGGGAALEFLEGKVEPGVACLMDK